MNEGEKEYQNGADYTKIQKLIIICIIRKYKQFYNLGRDILRRIPGEATLQGNKGPDYERCHGKDLELF